jgi:hypothetical protein
VVVRMTGGCGKGAFCRRGAVWILRLFRWIRGSNRADGAAEAAGGCMPIRGAGVAGWIVSVSENPVSQQGSGRGPLSLNVQVWQLLRSGDV